MGNKDTLMGRLLGSADKFSDRQIAETLALLVEHGLKRGASDIHIEPHERFILVRYRIDGSLRGMHKLPRPALANIMAQLKAAAGMNVQQTKMPQEGEYATRSGGRQVGVRVATMPVFGGEKAVLHLGEEHGDPVDLAELGFWGDSLQTVKAVLASPHGLLLVAGPRQSGVSSTLFSLLRDLNSPLVNVATVETGLKHRLPGVNQTYLAAGMSIQEGLEGALKQDANIIMLDNVPDGPTAEAAVHAATSGHLVVAGLHADNSISAVLRLRHAGVEPYLLATALRVGIGQRLVRKLCTECRERYAVDKETQDQLESSFGMANASARKRVHELERAAAPTIFGDVKQLNSTASGVTHLWRPHEGGCEACGHSGYSGRLAIVEVLKNTDALHKALLSKETLSATAIQTALLKDGFIPLALDGLVKALRGQTTIAEVLRAMSS